MKTREPGDDLPWSNASSARRAKPAPGAPRRNDGSASLELVLITPFLVVLMAAIWDIRAYTAYRTDVAREIYAIADLLAATGDGDWDATEKSDAAQNIVNAAAARLDNSSVGWLRAVVITRLQDDAGPPAVEATNSEGRDCDAAAAATDDPDTTWDDTTTPWCEPEVRWQIGRATWGDQGACANIASEMPAQGVAFAADEPVLPHEDADPDGNGPLPAPSADEWVSRSLQDDEWWVVVEVCSHFGRDANPNDGVSSPGLLLPGIERIGLGTAFFDARLTLRSRAAWGALDALDECEWEWCD